MKRHHVWIRTTRNWEKTILFTDAIHGINRNDPSDERSGLTNQKDFLRFIEITTGFLCEI